MGQSDILNLMQGHPEKMWTSGDFVTALDINRTAINDSLVRLLSQGLVKRHRLSGRSGYIYYLSHYVDEEPKQSYSAYRKGGSRRCQNDSQKR